MLKTFSLFGLIFSLIIGLSACGGTDNSIPPAELKEFTPRLKLKTNWVLQLSGGVDLYHKLTPVIQDGAVYTVSAQGLISKVSIDKGDIVWQKNTDIQTYAGLAVSDQNIVLLSREGDVFVYENTKELTLKWTKKLNSEINTPAAIAQDQLFVRLSNGALVAMDINTGKEIWLYTQRVPSLSITGTATPIIFENYVFSGFDNGKFVVLEKASGEVVWQKTISVPKGRSELDRMVDVDGKAVIQDGVIYISNYQGRLMALSLYSGDELWSRPMSSVKAMSFDQQALYVTDVDSMLWAIDRRNGTVLWKQDEIHHRRLTAMTVQQNTVVCADFEGFVHWLDKTTGKIIARLEMGKEKYLNAPLLYKDSLLLLDAGNNLSSISIIGK